MTMKTIRTEELRPVFAALEDTLVKLGIDFYIIGAKARDAWFERANVPMTGTKDVDFAVMVSSEEEYRQIIEQLVSEKGYIESTTNDYAIISPEGYIVDLMPFGAVEIDGSVTFATQRSNPVKVNGFMEVYREGTEAIEIIAGHTFEVATLAAVVLLKCISYEDRPEMRAKDPRDVANILQHYFELEEEHIYSDHNDLYRDGQPARENEQIAAIVIGREIRIILGDNEALVKRLDTFLENEIGKVARSKFLIQMVQETDSSIEKMLNLLLHIRTGLHNPSDVHGS